MTNDSEVAVKTSSEIVFDTTAGISEEEQREILADINGIAEKNRRSLSSSTPAGRINAQKNGGLFPLAVNGIAVVFLVGGFFLLSSLHGREDTRLREGTKVFNTAERALINEIRKETSLQIEEKENEINQVVSKMGEIDLLLQELHSSNQELTAEQRSTEENLRQLQEEYRQSLTFLHDDRSRILESARAREAALQSQLEARTRELSAAAEQKDAALDKARSELERLSTEQEKAQAIEAQLGAYFASASERIRMGQLSEASEILGNTRQFLNTPSFQGIRVIQSRKEHYVRTISVMETLIEEMRKNQAALAVSGGISGADTDKTIEELTAKNSRLEENIEELNRTISALGSQGTGTAQRLLELQNSAEALRVINSALEAANNLHEQVNSELETQNAELARSVTARETEIGELRTKSSAQEEEIQNLDTQLTSLRQALQALSQ